MSIISCKAFSCSSLIVLSNRMTSGLFIVSLLLDKCVYDCVCCMWSCSVSLRWLCSELVTALLPLDTCATALPSSFSCTCCVQGLYYLSLVMPKLSWSFFHFSPGIFFSCNFLRMQHHLFISFAVILISIVVLF